MSDKSLFVRFAVLKLAVRGLASDPFSLPRKILFFQSIFFQLFINCFHMYWPLCAAGTRESNRERTMVLEVLQLEF